VIGQAVARLLPRVVLACHFEELAADERR